MTEYGIKAIKTKVKHGDILSAEEKNFIIKALEKQIPKKPIETPTDDTCLYYENYCSTCKKMLVVKYKHCPSYDQKLDWETEL